MKGTSIYLAFCFIPLVASSQSTVEYQVNAAIEVQTGADVSADNIITNSNYSGGGTFNGGPLPVEMAEMTVQAAKNTATISWSTSSETDNFGFEIERREIGQILTDTRRYESENELNQSHDSRFAIHNSPQWLTIGFVQGAGTSSSPRDYSFVDNGVAPGRYAYRIKQIDQSGTFTYTAAVEVEVGLAPKEFMLSQNYPNPFNPTTTIEFTLPEDGHVALRMYDVVGREVATFLDEERPAGYFHQVTIDASSLGSGSYFLRLEFGGQQLTRRIVLVK